MKDNVIKVTVSSGRLVADTEAIPRSVTYQVSSEIPVVVVRSQQPPVYEFVTDGSHKYEIPPSCGYRKACAESAVLTLSNYLDYEVGSVASQQILEEWSRDLSEYVESTTVLFDVTDGKVLNHGSDWHLEPAQINGDFDNIVVTAITEGHALRFFYGLWPAREVTGQGTTNPSVRIPSYAGADHFVIVDAAGKVSPCKVALTRESLNRADILREEYFPEHLAAAYPSFVKAVTNYFRSHTLGSSGAYKITDYPYDPDTAPPSVLERFRDQYLKGFPARRTLLKNTSEIWSTKGSVVHSRFVSSLFGADTRSYWTPKDRVAETSSTEFLPDIEMALVQLDQLDINGLSHNVRRLPGDPPVAAVAGPDVLQQLDGVTVHGMDSGVVATLEFIEYRQYQSVRVAWFRISGDTGGFLHWERIVTHLDGIRAYVVPVVSAISVDDSGTGYCVGDAVTVVDAVDGGKFAVSEVDASGRILGVVCVRPAILCHGDTVVVSGGKFGAGAALSPIMSGYVVPEGARKPSTTLSDAVLTSDDMWHQFSYVLVAGNEASKWLSRYRPVAHPSGAQVLVEHVREPHVVVLSDRQVASGPGWVALNDKYWPEKPRVIDGGTLVDEPQIIVDYDTREEQLFVSEGFAVVARKHYRQWGLSHGVDVEDDPVITAHDHVIIEDHGTFVAVPISRRPVGAGGLLTIPSDTSVALTSMPHDMSKWQTEHAAVVTAVKSLHVSWNGYSVSGGISSSGSVTGNSFSIKALYASDAVVRVTVDGHYITLSATASGVAEIANNGAGVITSVTSDVSSVADTGLKVLLVTISLASAGEHAVELSVLDSSGIWYCGAMPSYVTRYWPVAGSKATTRTPIETMAGDSVVVSMVVTEAIDGTTFVTSMHPTYELNVIKAPGNNIAVIVDGTVLGTAQLTGTRFRLDYVIDSSQKIVVYVDGKMMWSSTNYHTPASTVVGSGFSALFVNSAKITDKAVDINSNYERFV